MAQVPYSGAGVETAPETSTPNDYQNIQARPQAFGAQVGEATQKFGDTGGQIADHYAGLVMETLATNAESDYIQKSGQLTEKFKSLSGLDAQAALPQYQADMDALRTNMRSQLPMNAAHAFDGITMRRQAYALQDAYGHVGTQIKQANINSAMGGIEVAVQQSGTSDVANNDYRFGEQIGTIKHFVAQAVQQQGWGSVMHEDKPGMITFDDSAQGQQAQQVYESELDKHLGRAQQNRYEALASENVMSAYDKYKDNKSNIPGEIQAKLDAYFKPKIRDGMVDGYVNDSISQIAQEYKASLSSGLGVSAYNLGNVKTANGASTNTAEYENPATPKDGVILTANTLRNGYQGLTLQQIANKWAPSSENKTSDWLNNVSKASGIAVTSTPNLNDPQQLQALLKGIATAEKSPKDRVNFSDDVISGGVQAALAGEKPNTSTPTNAALTSGYPTQADYMATHRDQIINNSIEWAKQNFTGDPTMERTVRERMGNVISTAVQTQEANYRQDNQSVMRALSGEMTNGKTPSTFQELRSIPGIAPVLDRVAVQDSKFYETIDAKIAQFSRKENVSNSANGYETIMRTLDTESPNRIQSQDQLDKILGRSDGTGINMKDYKDAKLVLSASDTWKEFVAKNMKNITNANGNVDGLGQQRALQWYSQAMSAYGKAISKGDDPSAEANLIKTMNESMKPPTPSRMEQISNWAKKLFNGDQAAPQTVTVVSPDGQVGTIPAENLQKALAAGYKQQGQ